MKNHLCAVLGVILLMGCKSAIKPVESDDAKPTAIVTLSPVVRKTLRNVVEISGSFVPSVRGVAHLTFAAPGRISEILVKDGQLVRKGQILATLDTRVQDAQNRSADAAKDVSDTQAKESILTYKAATLDQLATVHNAELALGQAKLQRQSDVEQADLAYAAAKADLAKLRSGARPQEIAQAHQSTLQAQAARDRVATEYRRNQDLWPQGYVSKRQLEDAKTAFETAESALISAREAESLVREGARKEEIEAAESRTASSRSALESAKALGDRRVEAATAILVQAEKGVVALQAKSKETEAMAALARQHRADAAAAQGVASLSKIVSPYNGRVTRVLAHIGDAADVSTVVIELASKTASKDYVATSLPDQMASFAEGQLVSIDVGPSAISGRLTSISPAEPQTGLGIIHISCEVAEPIGTFASARVVIEQKANVVAVPDSAVLIRDGKPAVLVENGGMAKETEVKTGLTDNGFTEIVEGLKVGQKVVSEGGYELDDGAKIAESSQDDKKDDKKDPPEGSAP